MRTLLTILILGFTIPSHSQYSLNDNFLNKSVLLEFNNSSGSGFFLQNSQYLYLITAKHVVLKKEKAEWKESILTVKYYKDETFESSPSILIIDFSKLVRGVSKFSKEHDIFVMKIGKIILHPTPGIKYFEWVTKQGSRSIVHPFTISNSYTIKHVKLAADVFIFGYPKSLELKNINQYDFDRPLLRKGVVAGKNYKNNTIIIDCPSYAGNSGGPVVQILSDKKPKLIGFVTGFIPHTEKWINLNYRIQNIEINNSGYTIVEPIQKVFDIISLME
jgi:Trypsin-like peptidase domain